jgi:hypothetical protein
MLRVCIVLSLITGCLENKGIEPSLSLVPFALSLLFADSQPADQLRVPIRIFSFQVVEKAAALSDQLQEAAAGMMILGVCLEMFCQVVDAFAEERYLNLW